jgi:hypothetical protein
MTTILHKSPIKKGKLKKIFQNNVQWLLPDLRIIDTDLATYERTIDFLCINKESKLVIVNIDVQVNTGVLIEAMTQIKWLESYQGLINKAFANESIDFSSSPYIYLVAPNFSDSLKDFSEVLTNKNIVLIQYDYLINDSRDSIVFEQIFQSDIIDKEFLKYNQNAKRAENFESDQSFETIKKKEPTSEKDILTKEEIEEFRNFELKTTKE